MKVNGKAFRKAREEIFNLNSGSAENKKRLLQRRPAVGTQKWLAEKANVNERSIITLENHNQAGLKVIDSVSPILKLNGRALIIGHGQQYLKLDSPGIIDFRPVFSPIEREDEYLGSLLVMSIDPLIIHFHINGEMDDCDLIAINATLDTSELNIHFKWLYKVGLNEASTTWLGYLQDARKESLISPVTYEHAIMFNQVGNEDFINWKEFVKSIEQSTDSHVQILITAEFENFMVEHKVMVSIPDMKSYFDKGRKARKSNYPYFVQLQPIYWKDTKKN